MQQLLATRSYEFNFVNSEPRIYGEGLRVFLFVASALNIFELLGLKVKACLWG